MSLLSLNTFLIAQNTGHTKKDYFQQKYKLTIAAHLNQYNYNRYNQLTNQKTVNLNAPDSKTSFLHSGWQVTMQEQPVKNETDALDYTIIFSCISGSMHSASISLDIIAKNWNENNYVLLPGAVYNGNRYQWRRISYSPKLQNIKDIGVDKQIIINDVPKLNDSSGISRIQVRSGNMSTPAIGFRDEKTENGVWLLSDQGNELGDYGIGIEEMRNRNSAIITLTSPVVRELFSYTPANAHAPSWDIPKNFKKGDKVTFHFRIYGFNAPVIQSLFDKFSFIRKDLSRDSSSKNTLPYSECMQTLEKKFNTQNFVPSFGYYSVGMRENFLQDWQIGWTGGMISTYPLLFSGSEETKKNVLRNFDWLFPNGISPSGFYWDAGQKGNEWFGGDVRNPHTKNWHLIRKSGDAVWYIIKQFMLMDKMGITVKQSWKDGNRKVCDALVHLWIKYHQLGQFVDAQSGDIVVGGSSSGAIVPAALTLASVYYQKPNYLNTAKEIAAYLNSNFTQKGISCGGPADALQGFDSESSYALLESYTTLFEHTNDKVWLYAAEDAAHQFASWVVSYNYRYNDSTAFGKLGIKTIGTVYANIQNQHAAPGICTASGLALLKLYRFTNDIFYLNLLKDIAHNITQYLSHPQHTFGNESTGWVSERINLTDWEGPGTIGYILPLSTWAETSLMLTTIEIPGLYVEPSLSRVTAFDNVNVKVIKDDSNFYNIAITNPSAVTAEITLLVDQDKAVPWLENRLFSTDKLKLEPGQTIEMSFKKK